MSKQSLQIAEELNEGIYEVFSNFYGDIEYYPLTSISTNIYGEDKKKVYATEPKLLLAKPAPVDPKTNLVPINHNLRSTTFLVPRMSFEKLEMTMDCEELEKGVIKFNQVLYRILNVSPRLDIGGVQLSFLFTCEEDTRPQVSL